MKIQDTAHIKLYFIENASDRRGKRVLVREGVVENWIFLGEMLEPVVDLLGITKTQQEAIQEFFTKGGKRREIGCRVEKQEALRGQQPEMAWRNIMVRQDEMTMVTINEFVKVEGQELNSGDTILCDVESLEPGDLALAQVSEDGLLIIGRVRHYSLLRGPARREGDSGS